MSTATTRTFRSGNSDAVRLPKHISFGPDVEVVVERRGDVVTISPVRKSVKEMLAVLRSLPKPSTVEVRDVTEIPERPGL